MSAIRHVNSLFFIAVLIMGRSTHAQIAQQNNACHLIKSDTHHSDPIPFDRIGAIANPNSNSIGITATSDGVYLRTGFQKLCGEVTHDGFTLTSTDEVGGSVRLGAQALGRNGSMNILPAFGSVSVNKEQACFTRPGLTEEYSVSADGIRQDFVLNQRPTGNGDLLLHLALHGAKARVTAQGASLTLNGSGRELAYTRLYVTDATGKELKASMEVNSDDQLIVHVADANAIYPVRVDPTFTDADWSALGAGTNGTVFALAVIGTDLYVGGNFSLAGGEPASRIAKWDGSSWSALGTGVNGDVYALTAIGTELYVGGNFTTAGDLAANFIAKWDGNNWVPLGLGLSGFSRAFAVIGTDLYVGGGFSSAGGTTAHAVAKWDGSNWAPLGTGLSSTGLNSNEVSSLAVIGTDLYAGGWFTRAGNLQVDHIAKWDGSNWSALGVGMTDGVESLAVMGTDLYVGGWFSYHIAKWDGSDWSTPGIGMNYNVGALACIGTDLYAGGSFTMAGGIAANRIARWNGDTWSALGTGMNSHVMALASIGMDLCAAGYFDTVGTTASAHVAIANLGTVGIDDIGQPELTRLVKASVMPNPNLGKFQLLLETTTSRNVRVDVLNAQGKVVWKQQMRDVYGTIAKEIDLRDCSKGLYQVRIICADQMSGYTVVLQ